MRKENPEFIVIDLFCGAGGTTTGFKKAKRLVKVIACVNHDHIAIKSHYLNNKEVKHFNEDIRTLDLTELIKLVNHYRKLYPNAKLILWASLECTNFSKAKGGKPRDADSRTLADHLQRYVIALNPDIIQIENVVEFMSWGPLDENGKPVSRKNGVDWVRWRKEICSLGYHDEWKEMNAADFGAYTSRNRLFGMFSKEQNWICWPEPTHFKNPSNGNLFDAPKKWKPVKEVLDLADEGLSIFGRKKNLSPNTYERIYAGLVKYIANGDTSFIKKYYSGRPEGKVISVDGPAGTICTVDTQAIVQPNFIANYYSSGGGQLNSLEEPTGALTTVNHKSIIQPKFLIKYNSNNAKTGINAGASINKPSPVITTQNRIGIIQSCFLTNYYSNGGELRSLDQPGPTIPTKDRTSKIQTVWLDKQFSGSANHQSVDRPAGSILSNDKHSLMRAQPFIMSTNFKNTGRDINSPAPVITANRKWQYLVNPQWGNSTKNIDKPCFTLIARMDKAPPYIVTTETGQIAIQIFESDSLAIIKIKEFMAAFGIIDIKMRMLKILELLKIQGFPSNYKLEGTQADQKKFIGNSVCPDVVAAWIISISNNQLKLAA